MENSIQMADFFVAVNGDDTHPGTSAKPFATLTRARDAVRELKKKKPDQEITVLIRGGAYTLSETAVFGLEDSGEGKQRITYAAYPGEEPVFGSGVRITGWKKLKDEPEALPEAARGKVWVAAVPEGIKDFYTLYEGSRRMPRARSKGFSPTNSYEFERMPGCNVAITHEDRRGHKLLHFPEGALKNWDNLEEVEIYISTVPWSVNYLPLEFVDEEKCVAITAMEGSGTLGKTRDWEESVWVENAIDFLDMPGEWVLNTKARTIYLYPRGDTPGENIVIPSLVELMRIEGSIDFDGPNDTPVRNLTFRGLTFTHGDRDRWENDWQGKGVQHNWELYDWKSSLVRLRGAENCVIEKCRFTNSGATALRLDLYCQENRVEKNLIDYIGNIGILLCGYGPGTKDVNKHNEILDNNIHHVGEVYWHGHGIMIWQSGENRVAHNYIHHCPRKAICVSGVRTSSFDITMIDFAESSRTIRRSEIPEDVFNGEEWARFNPYLHSRNNVIKFNEVYRVMEKLGDGAAINISGAGTGNLVRRNYVHHVFNNDIAGCFRTDGWQRGTTFQENVIYKTNKRGFIRKDINHIENNIIIDAGEEGFIGFAFFPTETPTTGSRIQHNVLYATGDVTQFYRARKGKKHGSRVVKPEECDADYNVFYSVLHPEVSEQFLNNLRTKGTEQHSISEDPMFEDFAKRDFRFKPESPALKLGIRQVDIREAGLTKEFPARFRSKDESLNDDEQMRSWRVQQTGSREEDNL